MKKYFLFFVALNFASLILIGCQTAGGPISSQASASPLQQAQTKKSKYCLVSDDENTIVSLNNRRQTSCDPAVVVRYINQYGLVMFWEFMNDHEIKTTSVVHPSLYRFGTKDNPHIVIESYQKTGNIFVQRHYDGCKQTYEISKETTDSITLIDRGVSSNCSQAVIKASKGLLNQPETFRKVYY